ncbi:MAG TPA: hypothetical protein VGO56_03300 [Pyrinomonadaceae bacterium]|nr:hypothetical protein [Pyrinomonadaceae bacterium]
MDVFVQTIVNQTASVASRRNEIVEIYLRCVADATRGLRDHVVPALKDWAKFIPPLRVVITVCDF